MKSFLSRNTLCLIYLLTAGGLATVSAFNSDAFDVCFLPGVFFFLVAILFYQKK